MGADSLPKTILCAKTPELIETASAITDRKPEQSQTAEQQQQQQHHSSSLPGLLAKPSREPASDHSDSTLTGEQFEKVLQTCSTAVHEAEADRKLKEIGSATPILPSEIGTDFNFKREIVWKNVIGFLALHICGWIGLHLAFWRYCDYRTTLYTLWLMYASGQGVTMGAHRLWSHRAFKAKLWLRIILLWMHTLAGQNCLYVWVRDHRQHHKFSDTDADPHNANRGFFFSHIGWLLSRKHPKVIEYGKKIDMSDLEADPLIMFQKRHYKLLYTIFALFGPTAIPVYFWGENPWYALFVAFFFRTVLSLNGTWSVNSAAHMFGTRPYDKTMWPVENMFVSFVAVGEGWHNYHHAFPWDYRASEYGTPLNLTGTLIDLLAKVGAIWDRKTATSNMVKNRVMRTGDKSHHTYGTDEGRNAFTTLWNVWKHPSNPSYNSIYTPKPKILQSDGYALIPDELKQSELDEDILSKENEELLRRQREEENRTTEANQIYTKLSKYIKEQQATMSADEGLVEEALLQSNNNGDKMGKAALNVLDHNDNTLVKRRPTTTEATALGVSH
ncbi:acyl-CoA Delta-9 desaturase-like [Anopheles aquasalis]|uniref:acyl-CoA Delta-9 desaturase-like n=1 Tax=Anopheles aquasalis TaxID=42839 RepID=UPI00215B1817|nr:acyl-CoA Delta-9 desaturase-like [Anopheles aquasalis]XP_050087452.1 acyl-CoA Delta-9 desaturase-like [Anopheles aquasalis]XP_050087453.1 acyl-CoA Delta-9 desaturase-like [Anopheles aquasalis]